MLAVARVWAEPTGRAGLLMLASLVLSGCGINQIPTLDERAKGGLERGA